MPKPANLLAAAFAASLLAPCASAQTLLALPDQTSSIRLSNRDINHVVCEGGDIEDVRFSAEKAISVEKGGSDAWIKFLVKESDDQGVVTRTHVTAPSEFFIGCNGAIYPLYAQPDDIPAQTIRLARGPRQLARDNQALLGAMVEEERAVSIILSLLQERVPASFTEVATAPREIMIPGHPELSLTERRRILIEGAGMTASEYLVKARSQSSLDERDFLDAALGDRIFAISINQTTLRGGETARLIILRHEVLS
ncbi:type-F conjugative transfer system secretin TraK [Sphingobium naphthae]|nr:type-F conjugative transfer system secretin TraK [Sphingobium naphthae]